MVNLDGDKVKEIKLNVDILLYEPAKKKAYELGIPFEEYLWRLVNRDLKGKIFAQDQVEEIIDKFMNPDFSFVWDDDDEINYKTVEEKVTETLEELKKELKKYR